MTNLEKYLYQLRRIEQHREAAAEKEIRKIYKELLKELNGFLGNIYASYSEDDMLDYSMLAKAGMDARFLEEVEQQINGISPRVAKQINETVTQTYEACYDGMRNAVVKSAGNKDILKHAFASVTAVTPEVIRAAVNNPVSGLTLKDTLEKHRKEIIYDIKQNIGVGLTNGDRYSTMAKRIANSLDGDYNKAVRIVRTETHRVRESGFNDAAAEINTALENGTSGYVMAKTWRTMQDERVRPKGQKGKKARKYNHVKMDGVTIAQNELFVLPSGAKGKAPSQTGVAGEDINCRCYLSYDLVLASELTKVKNGEKTIEEAAKVEQPKVITQEKVVEKAKEIGDELLKNPDLLQYDNGYCISNHVNKVLGYDNLPQTVSSAEFNRLASDSKNTLLFRGVKSTDKKTAAEMVKEFKTGRFYCGKGAYGNGTYTDIDEKIADIYASKGGKLKIILPYGAKVADFTAIYKEWEELGIYKLTSQQREAYQDVLGEVGVYAALKGYDAIALNGVQKKTHVVILNRGKVIVEE